MNRLSNAGFGCKLAQQFCGLLLNADDMVFIAHSLTAIRQMLRIRDEFATESLIAQSLSLYQSVNATK